MAVTVKTGGNFTKTDGQRPGLYVRFVERAIAAIGLGARSKVATVKVIPGSGSGTAVADKVYRVTNMEEANALFGSANVKDIQNIFVGGASEVVIATMAEDSVAGITAEALTSALGLLETYEFHVFVGEPGKFGSLTSTIDTWLKTSRNNGKNFLVVYGDSTLEGDTEGIKTRAASIKDEYAVLVSGGVRDAAGNDVSADLYACYIAGAIAGTALDGSITYMEVPYSEVITRYGAVAIQDLLAAGVLVTVMDGDTPKIEQGLTLGDPSNGEFNKIRTVRAKQAMVDDIDKAVKDSYIGKITNSPDGQIAVINAIKTYLETLAASNVIDPEFVVELDPINPSVGAELYINISVRFLDSIEYIYLTISI